MLIGKTRKKICLCHSASDTTMTGTAALNVYRPPRSWGKVIFSQASVILSTGVGVCIPACTGADTPLGKHPLPSSACWDTPPAQCMLGYTPPSPPAATAADGTHPTGMHSLIDTFENFIVVSSEIYPGGFLRD